MRDWEDAFSRYLEREKEIKRAKLILKEITTWKVGLNLIVPADKTIPDEKQHLCQHLAGMERVLSVHQICTCNKCMVNAKACIANGCHCIKMPFMTNRMLWSNNKVGGIWPHYSLNCQLLQRRKGGGAHKTHN